MCQNLDRMVFMPNLRKELIVYGFCNFTFSFLL
nr:MAG TPA: hypothetical protein [Caudoviricetes sp.]